MVEIKCQRQYVGGRAKSGFSEYEEGMSRMKDHLQTRIMQLTLTAILVALIAAATMMIRLPIPATTGYST